MLDPMSLMTNLESEIFNYTTGRFLVNDAHHLRQRRRVFDIPGLFKLIAKAMNCKTDQITDFRKLGEGGLNRVFLITLDTEFQLIARVPYPRVTPKAYVVASEVATMDFLRSKGLPIPKVYEYSFSSNNEAKTEYILMEYVKGTDLSQIWFNLQEDEIVSLMDQLANFESTMMSISFPAGGSIYYARDLMELSGDEGIPLDEQADSSALEKGRFCIGPDLSIPLWYGRREQLDVFRGPYEDAKSVLVTGAKKELAYLDRFGAPRVPYQRFRREYYKYEKQTPSDHVKNLGHYLRLAPSLVPDDDALSAFCIRHPDLTENNIRVSTDSGGLQILSVLDWQHAAVLPLFLNAFRPDFIQNEEDEVSRTMVKPELPDDFDKLPEEVQGRERELLRCRLVHFHYNLSTWAYNRIHHQGLVNPLNPFRRRIFIHASAMWEGETIELLSALIVLVLNWEIFATDGTPCPVAFTKEEIVTADKLDQGLAIADRSDRWLREYVGCGVDTWVLATNYERAKALGEDVKRVTLEASANDEETTEEDHAIIVANWPLDDMDEAEIEEYK
ncbi:kinase-like domain-containing protein [Mycena belliarum]|uniref:Kinase-like domain-containing protein n=1 Tax=Mycena belliarum TaxID=1033014 RepID=A0AAD6XYN2_9AGAR|nr:kinase-like domain-containing protein [Mycena belliae]